MSDAPSNPSDEASTEDDPAIEDEPTQQQREPSGGIGLGWVAVGAVIATVGFVAYLVKDIQDRRSLPKSAPAASSATAGPSPSPLVVPSLMPSASATASGR